ncbi:hypothetical protein NN561_012089 [Cricetulus griseus]
MPESVEVGASPPEGQRVVLSSRTRKGGQGGEDAGAPETPRQSRNCLCYRTGSSAEAATGAGHVRRWPCSWLGSPAKTRARAGGGGAGRRLSQPKVETEESGLRERGDPGALAREARLKEGCCGTRGAPSSACCGAGGRTSMAGGSVGAQGRQRGSLLARLRYTRRLRECLRPEQGGAALAVTGLVFFSLANPGTTGIAILA